MADLRVLVLRRRVPVKEPQYRQGSVSIRSHGERLKPAKQLKALLEYLA